MIFCRTTIAHDKGKPVVKQGRKAVSLTVREFIRFQLHRRQDCLVAEGDWRQPGFELVGTQIDLPRRSSQAKLKPD
jgi:hypothetical protein